MFARALHGVSRGMNAVGTVLILLLMVLVNADVVGRGLLAHPIQGVNEFAQQCLVAIVFLQVADATAAGRMTKSDAIMDAAQRRNARAARLVSACFALCGAALFLAILAGAWPLFATAWTEGEYVGVAGIVTFPTWPVLGIIVLSSVVMILQFLLTALREAGGPPA